MCRVLACKRRRRSPWPRHRPTSRSPGSSPPSAPPIPWPRRPSRSPASPSAAVQGRSALGPRAGARVRLGRVPGAPWVTTTGSRQAHLEGFDLQANVAVAAHHRDGLEQLARYVLRPPIAQERLTRTADGRVLLTLKAEWSDGTTHLLFEPIELLERLAALTPRPRINLVLHHGVLAPHSRWRARAVAYGRDTLAASGSQAAVACGSAFARSVERQVSATVPRRDSVPTARPVRTAGRRHAQRAFPR